MEVQLQDLVEKIKQDGIASAEQQAAGIIAEAEKKAKAIVADAEKEAETLLKKTEVESQRFTNASEAAVKQACRNALIAFREGVTASLAALIKAETVAHHHWLSAAEFTNATRAEPGCLFYEWYRSTDRPDEYVLVEGFQDDAAEAHVNSEHFKKATELFPTLLVETPTIINTLIPGKTEWDEMAEFKVN